MWITQTYLSSPEPGAHLHIYYLFENYKETHVEATKRVQEELERLASTYPQVCILMPNPNSADRIEGEIRKNQKIGEMLYQDLPGVVVLRVPIEKLDYQSDEMFFIPLNYAGFSEKNMGLLPNSKRLAENIQKLRRIVAEDLSWQHRQLGKYEGESTSYLKGIFEAVELKPGIAGFRIDLKKLAGSMRNSSILARRARRMSDNAN